MLNWFTVFHILPRDTMSPTTRRKLLLTPKLLCPTNEAAPPVFGSNAQVSFCQTQPNHSFNFTANATHLSGGNFERNREPSIQRHRSSAAGNRIIQGGEQRAYVGTV